MTRTAFRKDSRASEDHVCTTCFRRCHGERGLADHMWRNHETLLPGWRLAANGNALIKGPAFAPVEIGEDGGRDT